MKSELFLPKIDSFQGQCVAPGSKSIANRALLLSALSSGRTLLHNLPDAEDIDVLRRALPQLGVRLERDLAAADSCTVYGVGGAFPAAGAELQLENAGTALRPLTAILCASHGHFRIDGNEQMRRRPVRDLIDALQKLGIAIQSSPDGCPPVTLEARGIPGGRVQLSGAVSSQFLSALLMAAPLAQSPLEIELPEEPVSKPYIDLSLAMMADFGVLVEREGYRRFRIQAPQVYQARGEYFVEGDASAATYFLAAGALPGSGPVRVRGLGKESRQGDIGFLQLLQQMGATIESGDDYLQCSGPPAGAALRALDVDMNAMPDAAMTLAVLALFCTGQTRIRNIANLRVKESERIRGLAAELGKLGGIVEEFPDALYILPPKQWRSAHIETYRDHRMAMAFALAAAGVDLYIRDPGCVAKTYRRFFDDFLPLARRSANAIA
ncbi:MAG: 3-phosphoshikimate 1-carboxyvinyltransferase [Leptospirales bacterium]|nr:3-phosphoshikimate 1-carboxyvinyltransferase [Leptospirales bacterium]